MFRKILKVLGTGIVAVLVITAALFAFGLRIVLDGGGGVHLRFVESASARLARIERDREAQRQRAPAPSPAAPALPAPSAAPTPAATAASTATPAPASAAVPASYWSDFRGPNRDGHYRQRPILTDWTSLTPIWKQPIGGGYASFVISRGHAFTIEQRGRQEVVAAYDVATGRELWTSAWNATFHELMGGDGPRATPTAAGGGIYALGGQGELRCLDETTGALVWRTNILTDAGATNLQWGMAAAPLVVDDLVVVLPGGPNGQSVVAYERTTGRRAWSALDDPQAYSSRNQRDGGFRSADAAVASSGRKFTSSACSRGRWAARRSR